jgi:hypothetical protein
MPKDVPCHPWHQEREDTSPIPKQFLALYHGWFPMCPEPLTSFSSFHRTLGHTSVLLISGWCALSQLYHGKFSDCRACDLTPDSEAPELTSLQGTDQLSGQH